MANPGGNYPGRQILLGTTLNEEPAFIYLVSGRSKKSQERYASSFIPRENAVRIKPTDPDEPFDPFRHYQAVRIDPNTGLLTVSNNQATQDPVFEVYSLKGKRDESPDKRFERIMAAIGPEYDSRDNPTPRVMGVVNTYTLGPFSLCTGITTEPDRANVRLHTPEPGMFGCVQTYDGNVEYHPFAPGLRNHAIIDKISPQGLADWLYEVSNYTDPKYGELRVCTIAGVRNGNGPGGWEIARRNRFEVR